MKNPLEFLDQLKKNILPLIIHLHGEDLFLRDLVKRKASEYWCGAGNVEMEVVTGTDGVARLKGLLGADFLFSSRKMIVLTEPGSRSEGTSLAMMGKNQLALLEEMAGKIPSDSTRLIIETGTLKKTNALSQVLNRISEQVDCSPPKDTQRRRWVELMLKNRNLKVSAGLLDALCRSSAPLADILADLEKISLATEEGAVADLPIWMDLTQTKPEMSVWELGNALGAGDLEKTFSIVSNLFGQGQTIQEVVPVLMGWNQQRLQVKSHMLSGRGDSPEGIPPFLIKDLKKSVEKISLDDLRQEQKDLLKVDRVSKNSLEDPEQLFYSTLIKIGKRNRI